MPKAISIKLLKYVANLQESTHREVWFRQRCKATLLKLLFGMGVLP